MRSNGDTNPISVLAVVALLGGAFYAWHVAPLYLDNLDVREACTQALNVWSSEDSIPKARGTIIRRLNMGDLGWHFGLNDDEEEVIKPGMNVNEENLVIEEDDAGLVRTCRLTYERTIQFKPLQKRKTYPFVVEVKQKRKK